MIPGRDGAAPTVASADACRQEAQPHLGCIPKRWEELVVEMETVRPHVSRVPVVSSWASVEPCSVLREVQTTQVEEDEPVEIEPQLQEAQPWQVWEQENRRPPSPPVWSERAPPAGTRRDLDEYENVLMTRSRQQRLLRRTCHVMELGVEHNSLEMLAAFQAILDGLQDLTLLGLPRPDC